MNEDAVFMKGVLLFGFIWFSSGWTRWIGDRGTCNSHLHCFLTFFRIDAYNTISFVNVQTITGHSIIALVRFVVEDSRHFGG